MIDAVVRQRSDEPLIDLIGWLAGTHATSPILHIADGTDVAAIPLPLNPRDAVHVVDRACDEGAGLLFLEAGDSRGARVAIGVMTHKDAARVAPAFDPSEDSSAWIAETVEYSAAIWGAIDQLADPQSLGSHVGDPLIDVACAMLLHAAGRRTPVVISGVTALAGALCAQRVDHRVTGWMATSMRSTDRAWVSAADRLSLPSVIAAPLSTNDAGGQGLLRELALAQLGVLLRAQAG